MRFAAPPVPADPDADPNVPHVGYAIGKSVGNAVVRNRIRRRFRSIIVDLADELPAGYYLIGARDDRAATKPYDELRDDLAAVLADVSRPS